MLFLKEHFWGVWGSFLYFLVIYYEYHMVISFACVGWICIPPLCWLTVNMK